jgi:hypothetical protein
MKSQTRFTRSLSRLSYSNRADPTSRALARRNNASWGAWAAGNVAGLSTDLKKNHRSKKKDDENVKDRTYEYTAHPCSPCCSMFNATLRARGPAGRTRVLACKAPQSELIV